MVSLRTSRIVWTCLLVATPMVSAIAQAPNTGVVRITDRGARPVPVQAASFRFTGAMPAGGYSGSDDGQCQCPECMGKKSWKLGKSCEHYCKHSPDHGYSIPGKWPIHRRGVQYNSYYPAAWLGTNGVTLGGDVVYPLVYQPTDTTQLGFYYQHVPFWMPQPNPLPARPIPAHWHMYAPTAYASSFENGYGGVVGGAVIYETATPTTTSPTPAKEEPAAKPADNSLPPAPLKESAVPQPIERIGY
jgi:hypothetical protein